MKPRQRTAAKGVRGASDLDSPKANQPAWSRTDRTAHRRRAAVVGAWRERSCRDRGRFRCHQRRPRSHRHGVGRSGRTVATSAVVAGIGARETSPARFGLLKLPATWQGLGILVQILIAARLACGSHDRVQMAIVSTPEVAGVRTAAEGEVNHRGDDRDDADKRSHRGCLSGL